VGKRFRDATFDIARTLQPNSAHAYGSRHRSEIRILELDLNETERTMLNTIFAGRSC
jgi:hypothetical protein